MGRRARGGAAVLRWSLAVLGTVAALLLAGVGPTAAAPPPPPNPSDSELDSSRSDVAAKGSQVGTLANKLAGLENQLMALQDALEAKQENANKALVDMQSAQDAAERAQRAAEAARVEADAAGAAIEETRGKLDQFVGAVYQQGVDTGAASVLLGAQNPDQVLDRAVLMDAVSRNQLGMLDAMERARVDKANKDSAARAARATAAAEQARAERAKRTADTAVTTAQQATAAQVSTVGQVDAQRSDVERALAEAQQRDAGLSAQRQRYVDWQAEVAREQAAQAAREQAEAAARLAREARSVASGGSGSAGGSDSRSDSGSDGSDGPSGRSVQVVIDRALSQLGLPYAWGGGNGRGPSLGIRDGGVADSFGDFRKVGFDCSGLMIYAFAGAGIGLPHYSGYQYTAGRRVPLSQKQPGDMLFYGGSEGIHHVALYIGGGRMVEAPFSGSRVRVVPVRYGGGLLPYATRML